MENNQKTNVVGWFEIYVENMNRAKRFYESVFRVELEKLENPVAFEPEIEMWSFPGDMEVYGAYGALVKKPGFSSGRNSVLIYFACEDCAEEESRIKEFGGKIEKPKFSIGEYGFISLAYDTESNLIGLHSLK
ncbi:MAG: lactoylglutathione lyase [Bdellovibrionales bacterium RIFOXYB1_FULL_37_110]|nr:MAG: lactoylglutathione lyase [Bdellovibrionales bacterium RIFOXYC1_FULL_37_79]OFZ54503.1 MAG: lactoylglutathione lyase [Bdellovibrionales bacterium RIFOXYB2_FULL_36_6]OFZ59141.1 MAG: lactoylglutathione lyase [Bdellovibrionales bacterium RIFOXYB1_FULL_37_110]OFZ64146.1 MAG: lactoylglutathione lyase [Bdellovibrionales bacterium RIFOXYD1_FULL_36_51]